MEDDDILYRVKQKGLEETFMNHESDVERNFYKIEWTNRLYQN